MVTKHFVGLDLGQAQEHTALAVLEQTAASARLYAVRHLQRWPPGSGYPAILEDVSRLVEALTPPPMLALDVTVVGRPVVNLVRGAGLRCSLYAIAITSGHGVTAGPDGPLVPKKELVSTLQVLFQSRRLKVANTLPEAQLLVSELASFKARIKASTDDPLSDWREGAHDDLVLAVALAAWLAENRIEPYTGPLVCWPPVERASEAEGYDGVVQEVLAKMDRDEELGEQWWT
jgi:hypothetical protein